MNMHHEIEDEGTDGEIGIEKMKSQQEFVRSRRDKGDKDVLMLEKGDKNKRKRREAEDGSSGDEEDCQLVCKMIGVRWESFPFFIIVGFGACASVMPKIWCGFVPIKKKPQSRAWEYFRVANVQTIHNHGEKVVSMMTREGTMRDIRFTVCDVSKALGSVSQMCRPGHRVVFNLFWCPAGSYIEHIDIGDAMWLEEQNGFYVLNTKVAPTQRQSMNERHNIWNEGFGWPVVL